MINTIRDKTFKERHHYPSLEDIVVGLNYAFSISPKHQDNSSFTTTYMDHQRLFDSFLNKYSDFVLRPEISTKSSHLHYHGTIKFTSSKALASWYFHKIFHLKEECTFTIEPITDYNWYLYCIKGRHILKPYLQSINLPYKITNKSLQKIAL